MTKINSPHFKETHQGREHFLTEKRPGSFSFTLSTNEGDQVNFFGLIDQNKMPQELLAMKFTCHQQSAYTGVIDTYIDLILGKNEMEITSLAFREVENYLRTENNTPSILSPKQQEGLMSQIILFFASTKKNLLQVFNGDQKEKGAKQSPTIKNDYSPILPSILSKYPEENYISLNSDKKYAFISEVARNYIGPQLNKDGGDISIVFADDSMVVINYLGACLQCHYSLSSTLTFIQQVMRNETQNMSLLVMTDS